MKMVIKYNKTQLEPYDTIDKNIVHRDQLSHIFRWSFVLNRAKIGMNILDFGAGTSLNLLETFYRNKYKCKKYLGLDIRDVNNKGQELLKKVDWAQFEEKDLCGDFNHGTDWDMIISFEILEHIGKKNIDKFLQNIIKHCNKNTKVFISTPNYDEIVGAAKNHIINEEVGEFTYDELKIILEKYFIIEEVYGTFASQKDYKKGMNKWQTKTFESLSKYYDSNLISTIMAPIMDAKLARNCLWVLVRK